MIYIVHGNDYTKSRKLVLNQQKKVSSDNKVEIDISDIEPKRLFERLNSFDIFGSAPFIVLKVPTTKISEIDDYLKAISKTPEETTLVILAEGKLSKTNDFIKNAKELDAKITLSEKVVESNIFDFVDQLMAKNKKIAYLELNKLIKEEVDPFYIFSMILYGLRNVAYAIEPTETFFKKSPYVRSKADRQASYFSKEEIVSTFKFMHEIDKKMKTGQINPDVAIPYIIEKITTS